MTVTAPWSREFSQDTNRAKKAAEHGPVFITGRDRRTHVLLSIKEYERLASRPWNLVDVLSMPRLSAIDVDFSPPGETARPTDLS